MKIRSGLDKRPHQPLSGIFKVKYEPPKQSAERRLEELERRVEELEIHVQTLSGRITK